MGAPPIGGDGAGDGAPPAGARPGGAMGGAVAEIVGGLVERLKEIPGVVAVALGGSYASGTAHPDSDVDLGLYYREAAPFQIGAVRRLAESVNDTPGPTVTDFGGWGQWVNGGAWLTVRGQRVDFLYRSLERVQHWIEASRQGEFEQDYYVQEAFGFRSYIYLGELHICGPLHDPEGVLAGLKAQVATYPPALRAAIIRTWLPWAGNLYTLRKATLRGDVYMTAGCLARNAAMLAQVLFALNERYFVTDKGTLEQIEALPLRPQAYGAAMRRILAHPGETPDELRATVRRFGALHAQVAHLCRDWHPDPPPFASLEAPEPPEESG